MVLLLIAAMGMVGWHSPDLRQVIGASESAQDPATLLDFLAQDDSCP